ncbi:expressed unknown protein [Seminavis robusta]|uniref:Uncharacterized protein n=1 Tax=Seminavis robusta TaxID=568900 RepID=A0A9N8HA25_9STRA|nr:expressed unknown protein [Seminavis robusta]|eukprot:Sro276_g106120.1 n/a (436) ;mRNA; f:75802-77309
MMLNRYLALAWLVPLIPIVNSQHIQPKKSHPSELRDDETVYFLDVSGLGISGTDFHRHGSLGIQLLEDLPNWHFVNRNEADDHFYGETEDGLVACHLMRHSSNHFDDKLVGMLNDRETNLWYEIKPDISGEILLTVIFEGDIPPSSTGDDHITQLYSFWNSLRSTWAYLRDLPWTLRIDPEKEQVIDVMIIWSENSECRRSFLGIDCTLTEDTRDNMHAALELVIATTNYALRVSDTSAVFNLTHAQRDTSGYRETEGTSKILTDMGVPFFGQLSYIHPLRDEHKADLVSFVYDLRIVEGDAPCGTALLPLIRPLPLAPFLAWSTYGVQCFAGYTPTHEFGHNLGCFHDRGTVGACDDNKNTDYGYRSPTGTFRTIMAYSCTRGECDDYQLGRFCSRIPYFSGPASYQNGEVLGGEENNCRKRIRLDKRTISRFR